MFDILEIEDIPESQYTTVGGFLYELSAENLPKESQEFVVDSVDQIHDEKTGEYFEKAVKIHFIIIEIEDKRIRKVKVTVDYGELKKSE